MEWVRIILMALAMAICLVGVEQDRNERKFSNKYILFLMIIGMIVAGMGNRLPASLMSFLIINLLGIFMSALHIFGASDWKLFACTTLYIPIFTKLEYGIVFGICFVIYGIYQKLRVVNKGQYKQAFLDEWESIKYFIYSRKRLVIEEDNRGVYKEATIAATEGIVLAFFVTLLMLV